MRCTLSLVLALTASIAFDASAAEASHNFVLTYRNFGPVTATSVFRTAGRYAVRFEGCFAKHSDEAVCGFSLRAVAPLTVTNNANSSHGSDAKGSPIRTCCLFLQGDDRGYPITVAAASAGMAVLEHRLRPGETLGVMLRVPNYKQAASLAAVTFSSGDGDPGVQFLGRIAELP